MGASNWVHLEGCNVLRITEGAMLVEYSDSEVWLPLSQIDPESRDQYEEGDEDVTVSVTEWIASKRGLKGE